VSLAKGEKDQRYYSGRAKKREGSRPPQKKKKISMQPFFKNEEKGKGSLTSYERRGGKQEEKGRNINRFDLAAKNFRRNRPRTRKQKEKKKKRGARLCFQGERGKKGRKETQCPHRGKKKKKTLSQNKQTKKGKNKDASTHWNRLSNELGKKKGH